jgi:hypothetical protein
MRQPSSRVDRWDSIIAGTITVLGLLLLAASFVVGRWSDFSR